MTSSCLQEIRPDWDLVPHYPPGYPQIQRHLQGSVPTLCPNSLSPKLFSSVSKSVCVFLHPVLCPLSIVSWDMQWLQPLYSEQQLLELSDLKHNLFYLEIRMDRGDSHLILGTRGRGSGCGTAAMTMRGAVTNLATPIGGLEVIS